MLFEKAMKKVQKYFCSFCFVVKYTFGFPKMASELAYLS